jgi:hypothetical protein
MFFSIFLRSSVLSLFLKGFSDVCDLMKKIVALFFTFFWGFSSPSGAQESHRFCVFFESGHSSLYYRQDREIVGVATLRVEPSSLVEQLHFTTTAGGKILRTERLSPHQIKIFFTALEARSFRILLHWLPPLEGLDWSQYEKPVLASYSIEVKPKLKKAEPSYLMVLINGDFPFMDALGKLCIEETIAFAYHGVDYFYFRNGSAARFLEAIRQRQEEGFLVDVVTLTHGNEEYIASVPPITNHDIRRVLKDSPRLGLVYMIGCVNGSLVDDWLAVGAQSALSHVKNNYLPHLYFPYLFRYLGDGEPLHSAGLKAYEKSKTVALTIARFASYEDPDSIQREIHDSTPFFAGKNVTLFGKMFPEEQNIPLKKDSRFDHIERVCYSHTPLETFLFDLLKKLIPYSNRKALNYMEGLNPMFRALLPAVWEISQQIFSEQEGTQELFLSSSLLEGLMSALPKAPSLWIRENANPLALWLSPQKTDPTPVSLDAKSLVTGITFQPSPEQLRVLLEIRKGKGAWIVTHPQRTLEDYREGELYEIHCAPRLQADMVLEENKGLALTHIEGLSFSVHLSSLPDRIQLTRIHLDYLQGILTVEARSSTLVPLFAQMDLLKGTLIELKVGPVSLLKKSSPPK